MNSNSRRLYGTILLAIAAAASAMLVVEHFGGGLPGCGPKSACGDLAASVWGRVPGLGWPISFVGLAYFLALLTGWAATPGRLPAGALWLIRLGGAFSLLFLGVMAAMGKFCPYCFAVHVANLAFVAVSGVRLPRMPRASTTARRGLAMGSTVFVVALVALVLAGAGKEKENAEAAEAEREASVARMVQASEEQRNEPTIESLFGASGFTGRYRHGPELAAIRIVAFTDYQCPDCARVEGEIEELLRTRQDMSVSVMHFPFCRDAGDGKICNERAPKNLHPNACFAARAAEAAGIVGGDDAFWRMHLWLFSRKGEFTQTDLEQAVAEQRLDRDRFFEAMRGDETLRRIHLDVERAVALGLHYTPMIFINGVELKGWNAPRALIRTVEQVAAANPPVRGPEVDRPPFAATKYVEDWAEQRARSMPSDIRVLAFGAPAGDPATKTGPIEIIFWGDYQEENSAQIDRQIRAAMEGRSDIRYVFRHFPVGPECNHTLPAEVPKASIHAQACWAATIVEAAALVGGEEAAQRAHVWMFEHYAELEGADLGDVAKAIGVKQNDLTAALQRPEVLEAVRDDCRAGSNLGLRAIPLVYVDRKMVPRTSRDGDNIMERIIARATEMR